jgi:hypothetical protein
MCVLQTGLNKFFNRPAMRELLEVWMMLSSLGDPSKNEKSKEIRTYHCNDFGNDWLWLAVPCNGKVKPSCSSYPEHNATNPQKAYMNKVSTYTKGSV